ncbi:hypothetical protein [Variovorax sp. CAN15]|uniref:hypothetical protein n=1 Tax=Variovorax sp. CAN15 TaxID=3046727 RepID=UPI0026482186|nr:hypothetical protein [Variovorax sp. CAN15]
MSRPFPVLPLFLVFACGPSLAMSGDFFRVGEARRSEVRDAVAAHRAAQREEMRRGEAIAGRRLTPAELFELRQQVRGQWTPPAAGALLNSAESQPAERIVPVPPASISPTAPRSQRR